jgi:hypothetical protein
MRRLEPGQALSILGELREDLDRDLPTQIGIGGPVVLRKYYIRAVDRAGMNSTGGRAIGEPRARMILVPCRDVVLPCPVRSGEEPCS